MCTDDPLFTPILTWWFLPLKTLPVESASHGGSFCRFTPVMEISVSTIVLLFLHPAFPKLIVHPDKEAQLSTELLLRDGELLKSYKQPGSCNDVEEEVNPSRFQSGEDSQSPVLGSSSTILPPIWRAGSQGEECDNCVEPKLSHSIQLSMELWKLDSSTTKDCVSAN